jgi:hypothetical protein
MTDHTILSRPPVSQSGQCHYIAAAFKASPEHVTQIRTQVRRRPVAAIFRHNRLDLVMILSRPVEASEGLDLASRLAAFAGLPLIAAAPSSAFLPQWHAPRMTARDHIRVALAVGGPLDIRGLPAADLHDRRTQGDWVLNAAGTMTYAGAAP